jgi:CHAT domain-containing protein/Tfp pilus assembly protein PilF
VFLILTGLWWFSPTFASASEPAPSPVPDAAGWEAFRRGAFEQAVEAWTEAAGRYGQQGQVPQQIDALLQTADAYQALGRYQLAAQTLEQARTLSTSVQDGESRIRVLAALGSLALAAGKDAEAAQALLEALRLANEGGKSALSATILNNVGNLWMSQSKLPEAHAAYTHSLMLATANKNTLLAARAEANRAAVSIQMNRFDRAKEQLHQAMHLLQSQPPSHDLAYGLIRVGTQAQRLRTKLPEASLELTTQAHQAFSTAATVADTIGDARAVSYAWGYLGELYEAEHRDDDALELTRRAALAAQQAAAPESLYRWHWQTGRLLHKLGREDEAVAAYRRAIYALQSIRPELLASATHTIGATGFRDSVGGLYFELADLLLTRAAASGPAQAEPLLREARDVVELFKADELRDYFRDECVDAARTKMTEVERAAPKAAVLYPIPLRDRMELLVSLPTGLHRISVPVTAERLTQEVRHLRLRLEKRTTREFLPHAQQLYDWLIRPLEPTLAGAAVTTLVFVPDGPLRTIPLAALHDGERFLIKKYAVATSPGLTLTDPRPLNRAQAKSLAVGLTQSVRDFPPLPNVAQELETLQSVFPGRLLVDRDFQMAALEQELKSGGFAIVHIASHSELKDDPRKSFLLAYDQQVSLDQLDRLVGLYRLRGEPLAFLTLSACATAAGDDRAALGLAGVAIKAGANSALATLWSISDEASAILVSEFYRRLRDPGVSKAEALQRAQWKMLEDQAFDHPAYWSLFLLLNNWL